MATSLRTRLFLTVGIVLAVSIAASSLLSRRATLVEVNEIVSHRLVPLALDVLPVQREIEARMREAPSQDLNPVLADGERTLGRPLVLVDRQDRVLAGSTRELAAAHVRRGRPEGELVLDIDTGGVQTTIAVRGAPRSAIRDGRGEAIASLFVLPAATERAVPAARTILPPLWLLTTGSIGVIALILTFTLSRRILRPVSALTSAAERMQQGDLDVQVSVQGHDEVADLGRAFNSMALRLAQTERLRRQMVNDVAHELRSPVTHLRCSLEAIQDGLAQPDRATIDALHEETLFLQRLIADLQDLALAEAGRLALKRELVNLDDVVRRAAAPRLTGGEESHPSATVSIDIDADVPRIVGDPDRLDQVVRNLLSNARRHTPAEGTVTVRVTRDADVVRLVVSDTGCGIEPEHLSHVFDRFYRADQSRARATGGAGLGLAIVRQLVAAHGGSVSAASAGAGEGLSFTVVLPIGS